MGMGRAWWILGLALGVAGCASLTQDDRVSVYSEDGVQLFRRGDYVAARTCFQAALELRPEDPTLLYNLGECYDRLGNAAKAEHFYNACLQRAPNHAAGRHALDVLLVRSNRRDEATHMVQDWVAREPKMAAAYAEYGWLWREFGDLPGAQVRLEKALELDPHDSRALIELGLIYEAMQRPERAVVLYERVLERDPNQPDVIHRLTALQMQGVGPPRPE
jgi:tetratricopeptide (TPR) repeat protein